MRIVKLCVPQQLKKNIHEPSHKYISCGYTSELHCQEKRVLAVRFLLHFKYFTFNLFPFHFKNSRYWKNYSNL